MSQTGRPDEQTDARQRLLVRHQRLLDHHRLLQWKPFDRQEHLDHRRALRHHLAALACYRLA